MARLLAKTRSQCLHLGMCRLSPYCGVTEYGNVFRRWTRDGGSASVLAHDGQTVLSGILIVCKDDLLERCWKAKGKRGGSLVLFEAMLCCSQERSKLEQSM